MLRRTFQAEPKPCRVLSMLQLTMIVCRCFPKLRTDERATFSASAFRFSLRNTRARVSSTWATATSVFETGKDAPRTIQMLMRFFAMVDLKRQKAEIVFDVGEITSVLCLFEVITRGGVFD